MRKAIPALLLGLVFPCAGFCAEPPIATADEGAGACCIAGAGCEILPAALCAARGGDYQGDGTGCSPDPCDAAMTPIIGVVPSPVSFAYVCAGQCESRVTHIFNDADDPESYLTITGLQVEPLSLYELVNPPGTPFSLPGDGTVVPVEIRYCPSAPGPEPGTLTITAAYAVNSPLAVVLAGVGNRAPLCHNRGPYAGVPGVPIAFDGTASSDPDGTTVAYAWDFGDGGSSGEARPLHAYAAAGVYDVMLTVTDPCGVASSCDTRAYVGQNSPPGCDAGGPYAGAVGAVVRFNGGYSHDPDGVIVAYDWDFGDGATGAGVRPSHVYAAAGTYTVSLTVTDDDGASSTCQTSAAIEIGNAPPVCDAGGPYSGEVGQPIAFDGTGSHDPDGAIAAYAWSFGDGRTGSGPTPSHTYTVSGNFIVSLTVTDDRGARATCQTSASVSGDNLPPVCDAGGPYAGAVNQPIAFDGRGSHDPDGTIVEYEWDFGDCRGGAGPAPTHAYALAGSYRVTLCVVDDDGGRSCCQTWAVVGQARLPRLSPDGRTIASGANPLFSLPLHAVEGAAGCATNVNCLGVPPTVNVPAGADVTIDLLLMNHYQVAGVQTAFDWPADWVLTDVLFNCRPGQLNATLPDPSLPGGPLTGTASTAFSCTYGPLVAVIGRLRFTTGAAGCVSQVQSCYPYGVHAVDCNQGIDQIDPDDPVQRMRLGRICVVQGGINACMVQPTQVEPATWGRIKASYRAAPPPR